jgi:hypothetical protein
MDDIRNILIWDNPILGFFEGPVSELWRKVGDGVDQAAFLICGAASIPSLNMTP